MYAWRTAKWRPDVEDTYLILTNLPFLIGIGAAIGCLTGVIAQRVFHA